MPTEVINIVSLTKNPEFKNVKTINKNFRKIKKEHCNSLLEFLYNGGLGKWQNPFTKKFLSRESPIIISFLSRCYNMSDDSTINIHGCNLTYKKHIDKFINNEYLYVPSKKKSTNSKKSNVNTQSANIGGFHSRFPISDKIHSIDTVNTWPPPYFNTVNTRQLPLAQSFVKHREQHHVQPSYTFQIPNHHIPYHHTSHDHTYLQNPPHTPIKTYSHPFYLNDTSISTKSQQKGKFYESLKSGNRYYQREISDDIWKLIMNLGINYIGDERGEFIDKMNEKYEKDKEILDKWITEESDKNGKKIKEYYKREKSDRVYWSNGFYNFRSNAFAIDDIKAFNKFYGIKSILWD